MFAMDDYKDDVLAITDEQVAADWRYGLLRSLGKVVRDGAAPKDSMGSYGSTVSGSNREHIYGSLSVGPCCSLVEVYDVREELGEEYLFSTFGGSTKEVIELTAKATCACGRIVRHPVAMDVSPGELIYLVTNRDDE